MKNSADLQRLDAGGSPAATHFSCFAKKSKQKKATPDSSAHRASLRYSKRQAAAELGLVGAYVHKGKSSARPQTVLADFPCRSCVAQRLAWGPRRQFTIIAPTLVRSPSRLSNQTNYCLRSQSGR